MSVCRRSRHLWQICEREEQPSAAEVMREVGTPITATAAWPSDFVKITRRDVIVTRRCKICGIEEVVRV